MVAYKNAFSGFLMSRHDITDLKTGIFSMLSHFNIDIHSIRGQGYDGAKNMRGEWNDLQALVLHECPLLRSSFAVVFDCRL